uniref:Bifunctional endo-1,4-beta-xylanase xylA n=1 Tax=Solanum tuberosum TaxID=4113 RepID=M1DZR1_SOLTU
MAREPPVGLFRLPNLGKQRRLEQTNKTHHESSSNSTYNSTNSQNNEAMHIAISEMELDGIQKIISTDRDEVIHRKLFSGDDSPPQRLQHTKKSCDSTSPIERTEEMNSGKSSKKSLERRLQIRPPSRQFHGELTTGDFSHVEEVHLTAISSKMDGSVAGNMNSGEQIAEKMNSDGGTATGNYSMEEEVHLTNIPINIPQDHHQDVIQASFDKSTTKQQVEVEELNGKTEANHQGTFSQDHEGPNGKKQDLQSMETQKLAMNSKQGDTSLSQDQNDQHGNTKSTTLEVIEVESSSQFSFGVKPSDTIPSNGGQQRPGMNTNYNTKFDHDHRQELQAADNNAPRKNPREGGTQAGKFSHPNLNRNVVNLSSRDDHVTASAKRQKNDILNDLEQSRGNLESQQQVERNKSNEKNKGQAPLSDHGGNSEPNNYHREFPKISSNFDRHTTYNLQPKRSAN